MSILVTGASGFVGSALLSQLTSYKVTAIARKPHKTAQNIDWLSFDLEALLNGLFIPGEYETVVHLAARAHVLRETSVDPKAAFLKFNRDISIELAKQMFYKGMKRFVFISSIAVNTAQTKKNDISTHAIPLLPMTDFGQSKLAAEQELTALSRDLGFELVIIRPPLVYGANAPGNFGSLTRLISKVPFLPFGLVRNRCDFISVNNLADLIVTCVTHPNASGHTFFASDNETVTIKEFTNAIAKGLEANLVQLPVPVSLMRIAGRLIGKSTIVEQLVGNLEIDSSKLKDVLGWTPPYTMEESMAFLKQEK
jgi:nucleoside-diphosphate-sugar epimerase